MVLGEGVLGAREGCLRGGGAGACAFVRAAAAMLLCVRPPLFALLSACEQDCFDECGMGPNVRVAGGGVVNGVRGLEGAAACLEQQLGADSGLAAAHAAAKAKAEAEAQQSQ